MRTVLYSVYCLVIVVFLFTSNVYAHVYLGPESVKDPLQFVKGEHNSHPGWYPAGLDEIGGPDAFGYVYKDNQEADGPDFNWIELSETGTTLTNLDDDDFAGPFALPWDFEFYGETYSEVYICSNGFLAFGGGSEANDNEVMPYGILPNNLVSFFWDDLDPTAGGSVYYGIDENNQWICQFDEVREYDGNGTITAEVILNESGVILFQYQSLGNAIDVDGETIGLENATGHIGVMVSLDSTPNNYPYNSLAIEFSQLPPDASINGSVTDSESGDGVEGATVCFGNITTVTDENGIYVIRDTYSGTYDIHIYADGFFDYHEMATVVEEGNNIFNYTLDSSGMPSGFVGSWTFDNPENLTEAVVGNDLILEGSHTSIEGPEAGDGAVSIGPGSFYRCYHDMEANGEFGNAEWVNQFTIAMDVRIPTEDLWYCLYQTSYQNSNDGDWFVNTSGNVGVGDTGYSEYSLESGEWYRLAISVNLGVQYNYYLDGQLLHMGGTQSYDGRFAIYPFSSANQVLFFADNNSEDNLIDVAQVHLFDRSLTTSEIASLGGYGHEFDGPEVHYMEPFLQTPTPGSIYVCWHSELSTESIVQYGTSEELGLEETGESYTFAQGTVWHWVQLTDLEPETTYYYKVVSDTAQSEIHKFTTQQPNGDDQSHIRFVLYSDQQTISGHHEVVTRMNEKLVELYGEDFHEEVQLVMSTGDIVNTGSNLGQYTSLFFDNTALLSDNLPFMNSIGNHEAEADNYYQYMLYEDFAGPEGEKYYSFWIGNALFISLNSNTQGQTQLNWLEDLLETAENDEELDWVFVFLHHPGHSETWPTGNTSWTQDQVIPLLTQYSKVEQLCYGHTHAYERGATSEGNLRLLCFGGGGGHLDRWGMYDVQIDYPEIFKSHDYYGYTIFDIDSENDRYEATVYTLGNEDLPLDNVVLDSWFRDRNADSPERPVGLSPEGTGDVEAELTASPYTAENAIMSSQFQLSESIMDWSSPVIDEKRDWINIFYDSGEPDFIPTDSNEGVDLTRLVIQNGTISSGMVYYWRMRYRDQNLQWSDWSSPISFQAANVDPAADFTADVNEGEEDLTVRFTDLSIGQPESWQWDLDGDGLTDSEERDPVFTYNTGGVFTITLTVHINGDEYTEVKENFITIEGSTVEDETLPSSFRVSEGYPNPFNPETSVIIELPEQSHVIVEVYNMAGQKVKTLNNGRLNAGNHRLVFNGSNVSSGIYFIKVLSASYPEQIRKVVLIK